MRLKFKEPLTAPPSKVIEKVLLISAAATVGFSVKLCCVHLPDTDVDAISADASTSPEVFDVKAALKEPL